jgi:type II secretion system protein E
MGLPQSYEELPDDDQPRPATPEERDAEEAQARRLAERYRLEFLDMNQFRIDQELFRSIPADLMLRYGFVPYRRDGKAIVIVVSDPTDLPMIDELRVLLGTPVRVMVGARPAIDSILKKSESSQRVLDDATEEFQIQLLKEDEASEDNLTVERLTSDISPIIRLVDSMIFTAIQRRASDIHVETQDDAVHVKYRIDGVLQPAMRPIAKRFHSSIISRIKVMAELDIAEKRVPQDGRFKLRVPGKTIDFRVSVMPSVHGEDSVIRILDKQSISEQFTELRLDILGFPEVELRRFRKYIREPYGMVLVTGPTGSGKTTTLYAALAEIKTIEDKIITIEDPVEYQLGGVNQIQVKPQIGLTFANGLRSIVRQDPDVIMVGEIRDAETAEIAVQAALTGHLVFSTLHTNDAAGAISRLLEMGVQDYLLSSSLLGVLAQRLVRRLCKTCRKEVSAPDLDGSEPELNLPTGDLPQKIWEAAGCSSCSGTGYLGRVGIFELLPVTSEICKIIVQRADAGTIRSLAIQQGMRLLRDDGWDKVRHGVTTVAEVLRVTREEV